MCFILRPWCFINGPSKRRELFHSSGYDDSAWIVFSLPLDVSVCDMKIGLVRAGFMNIGAESVNLRPGLDDQQSIKKNFMFILIFYVFSRFADLLVGRQTSLARA